MKTITLEVTDERYEELLKEFTLPKKQSRYVPKEDEEYWFVDSVGGVMLSCWEENNKDDYFRLGQGNVFRTQAEAQKHSAKLHAISEVTNYCYENDLVLECDWTSTNQAKWEISCRLGIVEFFPDCWSGRKNSNMLPILKSEEFCLQVIKEKEEALKLIFEI